MNTIKYSVPAINCNHCVHTIQNELSELEGVSKVEADLATKTVRVEYEVPASTTSIENLLAVINYPVKK
jgi:copper chaperone CopZ